MLLCNLEIHLHRLSDSQCTLVDKMLAALLTGHFPPPESLLTIYRSYMHAVFMVGVESSSINSIRNIVMGLRVIFVALVGFFFGGG